MRALVVEDDADIVELLDLYLRRDGWTVDAVGNGRDGLERLRQAKYDLVLLDVQLPGVDGLTVLRDVRRDNDTRALPIVLITARGAEADRVAGLELGADDYVVKPFSPKELMARVRAVRRRLEPQADAEVLSLGPLLVDTGRHTATWNLKPARVTAKEFGLLAALLRARGRVLTRQQLLEDVWGYSYADGTRTVDVHVRRLREKIPGLANYLVTVKSVGYRLAAPDPE